MLICDKLYKRYAKNAPYAVEDLTLKVGEGEIFGFLGPNGAGKSTTIKMIVSLLNSDSGEVSLDGITAKDDPIAYKRLIGYVADEPQFYDKMSANEHLAFIGDLYRIPQDERTERISKLAATLRLQDALNDEIGSFSHGMRQKLAIISALLPAPKLLVLDEPMVGLDPKASFEVKNLLKELAKEGKIVFFSTHVLEVAQQLCTSLGIINEGKLIYHGTFEALQNERDESLEELFLELTEKG